MSRSRNTTPHWVKVLKANDREDTHHKRCKTVFDGPDSIECDLERRTFGIRYRCYSLSETACLTTPKGYNGRREQQHDYYYNPERRNMRDDLRAALREYNTFGEVEVDPVNQQHRHAPFAGGWWWD